MVAFRLLFSKQKTPSKSQTETNVHQNIHPNLQTKSTQIEKDLTELFFDLLESGVYFPPLPPPPPPPTKDNYGVTGYFVRNNCTGYAFDGTDALSTAASVLPPPPT